MIIILLGIISLLLLSTIYIQYINVKGPPLIEKLEWPFLNIVDENGFFVDIVCIRGPLDNKEDIISFEKYKKQNKLIIGCSSYLSFPHKCMNSICDYRTSFLKGERLDKLVDGWLHPFKGDDGIDTEKKLLLSESDFVDSVDVLNQYDTTSKTIKYDFICYCPSDGDSCDEGWNHHNKNWALAQETIEVACNVLGLKGILIGRKGCPLNIDEGHLERHEKLEYYEFIKKISESKFIIISSYEDASPRVIGEALMLNTPILVNKDIIGGWKYVHRETGVFYDFSTIEVSIKEILERKYYPRKYFLDNYGIKNSGKLLRDFIVDIDSSFSRYKYLRFAIS
jgi:hypothetical protein|tara:strand:+ start:23 stop:1036 length:1014 start_codon:yes stop_codon:yes gene_type:complete